MKKHYRWKKTAAFFMSMALISGAMTTNVCGFLNGNCSITANAAAETKAPEVGAFYKVGDTIAITDETWFVVDDDPNSGEAKAKVENDLTITGYENSDKDNQYVWKTGDIELYILHNGFYITREDSSVDPEGFYITGGIGTYSDPFIVGLNVPKFSGQNITLSDDIGLNFIVDTVNENNADDIKVKLSGDCDETGLQTLQSKTINGQDVYCATANVSANKMGSKITAELYIGDSETPVDTIVSSVNDYLDNVDTSSDSKLDALVNATRQYGKVSEAYFNHTTLPDVKDYSAEILEKTVYGENSFYKYQPWFDSETAAISLVLNSKLAVRLYTAKYEQEHHDVAAYDMWTFDENNHLVISDYIVTNAIKGANGRYCFEVPGITPTQLGTTFNVNYLGTDYLFTPLGWAFRVMSKENAPAKDVAMANALYEYFITATDYVG